MDSATDRRKFETILREPLTRARFLLSSYLQAAQDEENPRPFTIEDLRSFTLSIGNNSPGYQREVFNVMAAVETGVAPQTPKFSTPETRILCPFKKAPAPRSAVKSSFRTGSNTVPNTHCPAYSSAMETA